MLLIIKSYIPIKYVRSIIYTCTYVCIKIKCMEVRLFKLGFVPPILRIYVCYYIKFVSLLMKYVIRVLISCSINSFNFGAQTTPFHTQKYT